MEITLEKIELIKDRTGVSYKEAKEALEAADGSVVDAIIAIEENLDETQPQGKKAEFANDAVSRIKELVKKGNISKITVKRDDEVILNIPLNVGIIGAIVAPWGAIAALIASFGLKCKIELTQSDGKVINITEKAQEATNAAKEKGAVVFDELKDRDTWQKAKEAGQDAWESVKEKTPDGLQKMKEASEDILESAKDRFGIFKDKAEADKDCGEDIESKAQDLSDMADEIISKVSDEADELIVEAKEESEETSDVIEDFLKQHEE